MSVDTPTPPGLPETERVSQRRQIRSCDPADGRILVRAIVRDLHSGRSRANEIDAFFCSGIPTWLKRVVESYHPAGVRRRGRQGESSVQVFRPKSLPAPQSQWIQEQVQFIY